ncbi:MAG: HTTM domain-containing protein [Planctomycetota bacterium]
MRARAVDGASLGLFRCLFGVLVAVAALRYLVLGWIGPQYLEPRFVFSYPGLDWLGSGPPFVTYGRFAALVVLGGLLAAGWRVRLSAFAIFLLFTWNHLIDKALYLNHYHLVSLLAGWLVLAPSDRAFAPLARDRRDETVDAAWLWLLRGQVGLVYVAAGLAKLHPDWLLRAEPLRLWLGTHDHWPVLGAVFRWEPTPFAFAWAGLVFDLSVPFLLLARRTRRVAFAALCVFHLATAALFPIGVFPWVMTLAATLFLAPDWPRRLRGVGVRGSLGESVAPAGVRLRPAARLAGLAFLAAQALWSQRGLLPEGDLLWHERGFRFSWRVMVMEKQGDVRFLVAEDRPGGRAAAIDPAEELTPIQCRMMAAQPDMILDYARHLRRRHEAAGWRDVTVRAESWASLNGDPAAPLVDPDVDLGRLRPGLLDRSWIRPRPPVRIEREEGRGE